MAILQWYCIVLGCIDTIEMILSDWISICAVPSENLAFPVHYKIFQGDGSLKTSQFTHFKSLFEGGNMDAQLLGLLLWGKDWKGLEGGFGLLEQIFNVKSATELYWVISWMVNMRWQTSWWQPLWLSPAVQQVLAPCCSFSSAISVQRLPYPAFLIRQGASPQSSSTPQDCQKDHSCASVLLRWPPWKEL